MEKHPPRPIIGYGTGGKITVNIRFDDQCKNGHQSFSITADVYTDASRLRRDCQACGCLHDDIARIFPTLAPLIKWHGVNTDGPTHYIANTLYHAGDRDCHGLRKGESRQIINGRTGKPSWRLVSEPADLPQYIDSDTQPTEQAIRHYVPWCRIGEGKTRDLTTARSTAVWPEATDEQLTSDELPALLAARLPALIAEFKADMERIGMLWEPAAGEVTPCPNS